MITMSDTHLRLKSNDILLSNSLLLFTNLMTSLHVYGIFQFERLADFMFTSGQPANTAPRFIRVRSELTGVLFGNNKKYL